MTDQRYAEATPKHLKILHFAQDDGNQHFVTIHVVGKIINLINYFKMDIRLTSLYFGLFWALIVFLIGLYFTLTKKDSRFIEIASVIYFGYKRTFWGCCCGAFWAFLDGFMSAFVILWILLKLHL